MTLIRVDLEQIGTRRQEAGLDSIDLYVEPGFLATRPDLLEVYPYQRHLKNYVQTFRRQYLQTRGRL